jgi:hypothetical protein
MAMVFIIGCASEKKMESQTTETAQEASTKADSAITPAAYQEVTLNVTGMT